MLFACSNGLHLSVPSNHVYQASLHRYQILINRRGAYLNSSNHLIIYNIDPIMRLQKG